MELTFSIVLDKRRQKKNLTYPLKLQIYQDRSYKVLSLGIEKKVVETAGHGKFKKVI